jgi:dolichyl-diphosphooligosaccharide--protein glycosyltransferase
MAIPVLDVFLRGKSGQSTRTLLRVIILLTIAAAAISSRLFSVIRFESIIHECMFLASYPSIGDSIVLMISTVDPWFNFRATKYLVEHGFYKFWDWFDDRTYFIIPIDVQY